MDTVYIFFHINIVCLYMFFVQIKNTIYLYFDFGIVFYGAFSIGMGLSLLKPPSRSVEPARPAICTGRVVRRGVCRSPLRWLSQFPSRRKTKISVC